MADKLISLVDCQKYIRHRDIWDLRWLKQQGAKINIEFIKAKLDDISRLDDIVNNKAFSDEMLRFIPADIQERTLRRENFKILLSNEVKSMLNDTMILL